MFTKLHTPEGTADHLPDEAQVYRCIEDQLKETFRLWGYKEIRSPTIEFVEALSTGVGPELVETMFKFQDFDGKMLGLRAEMTAPVARIVSTRMKNVPKPIRLYYVSNVFRYSPSYVERGREFWQAGVELVGCEAPEADGEILSLLITSLRELGLGELRIDVGHAGLLKDLLKSTGLDEEKKAFLQSLLAYRDETRLEDFMEKNGLTSSLREAFLQLSCCRRIDEVSSISLNLSEQGKLNNHITTLTEINDILTDYGVENFVHFDFSLTRKIEYYTGMVFEVSVPNSDLPLGGGGRYDDFIQRFRGLKLPATGFAVEIEKCIKALAAKAFKSPEQNRTRILISSKFGNIAKKAANAFRGAGIVTLLEMEKGGEKETIQSARLHGIDYVVFLSSSLQEPATVYDIESESWRKVSIETLQQQIRGRS